jgi:hypothetical protein
MSVALPLQAIALPSAPRFGARLLALFHKPKAVLLDRVILLFAVLAPFTNIPQLLLIYVGHKADLSLASWTLYVLFNIPLFTHGLIRNDRIILFNTALNMCMQLLVVAGILLYR